MPPKKGKVPPAHIKSNPVPPGTVIRDTSKQEISVGKELAQGGFGRICDATVKGRSGNFIIKFEPGSNGPLFVEQNVFIRILTEKDLDTYKAEKKLNFLGLPYLVSNGMHEKEIRFIVMPKYNFCLDEIFKKSKTLKLDSVKEVVKCVLNALEYLHSREYAHADIKAGNLMMNSKTDFSKVTLIDFGLAMKADKCEDKDNKKRAHNGSAFFTSIDAHRGIGPSYRGDIEIVAHNMLYWLTGDLPWHQLENKPEEIKSSKQKLVSNLSKELDNAGIDNVSKPVVTAFYEEAKNLGVNDVPHFTKLMSALSSPASPKKSNTKKVPVQNEAKTKKRARDTDEEASQSSEEEAVVFKSKRKRGKLPLEGSEDDELPELAKRSKEDAPAKGNKKRVRGDSAVEQAAESHAAGSTIIPGLSINRAGREAFKKSDDAEPAPRQSRAKKGVVAPTSESKVEAKAKQTRAKKVVMDSDSESEVESSEEPVKTKPPTKRPIAKKAVIDPDSESEVEEAPSKPSSSRKPKVAPQRKADEEVVPGLKGRAAPVSAKTKVIPGLKGRTPRGASTKVANLRARSVAIEKTPEKRGNIPQNVTPPPRHYPMDARSQPRPEKRPICRVWDVVEEESNPKLARRSNRAVSSNDTTPEYLKSPNSPILSSSVPFRAASRTCNFDESFNTPINSKRRNAIDIENESPDVVIEPIERPMGCTIC